MAFTNYEHLLERPFIVYADFESSLIPTETFAKDNVYTSEKISKHKANSACRYFVCAYDSSRTKLYEFISKNCVIELSKTLTTLSDNCIEEMNNLLI